VNLSYLSRSQVDGHQGGHPRLTRMPLRERGRVKGFPGELAEGQLTVPVFLLHNSTFNLYSGGSQPGRNYGAVIESD